MTQINVNYFCKQNLDLKMKNFKCPSERVKSYCSIPIERITEDVCPWTRGIKKNEVVQEVYIVFYIHVSKMPHVCDSQLKAESRQMWFCCLCVLRLLPKYLVNKFNQLMQNVTIWCTSVHIQDGCHKWMTSKIGVTLSVWKYWTKIRWGYSWVIFHHAWGCT